MRVDQRQFSDYLRARLPADEAEWERVHAEDLLICCGCVAAERTALTVFMAEYDPVIATALRRLRLSPSLAQDVHQDLLRQLIVGDENSPPMLAAYSGQGKLLRWLKVVTARTGRRQLEKAKKLVPMELFSVSDQIVEPATLAGAKMRFRDEFKLAFKQALAGLEGRDANLLRFRYIDGLKLEQIAAIHNVHLSTIHRRIERIREHLAEATHRVLAEQLQVADGECASLIRELQSNFDLTLASFIAGRPPSEDR